MVVYVGVVVCVVGVDECIWFVGGVVVCVMGSVMVVVCIDVGNICVDGCGVLCYCVDCWWFCVLVCWGCVCKWCRGIVVYCVGFCGSCGICSNVV